MNLKTDKYWISGVEAGGFQYGVNKAPEKVNIFNNKIELEKAVKKASLTAKNQLDGFSIPDEKENNNGNNGKGND